MKARHSRFNNWGNIDDDAQSFQHHDRLDIRQQLNKKNKKTLCTYAEENEHIERRHISVLEYSWARRNWWMNQ